MLRAAVLLSLAVAAPGCRTSQAADPLATEVQRWSELARTDPSTDEISVQVREGARPVLAEAEIALRGGRRLLALSRLAAARTELEAARYLRGVTASGPVDQARFEAEWKRMGGELGSYVTAPGPGALHGVEPAAIRALGEAALPQVRLFYEASLDYGRNTMPEAGLFYLGAARAQKQFADWVRRLPGKKAGRPPPLRSLAPELDALETELLAAYRPPASIDRHAEFIAASATLKEARELDAAGLRRGALLLYLVSVLRTAPLRGAAVAPGAGRLSALAARLESGGVDHSIGRLFLEMAHADLEGAPAPERRAGKGGEPTAPGSIAAAVADDVLPRYFAALEPSRPRSPQPPPRVTVTLVRWPFT